MKKLISPAAAAPAVLGPMISSSCAYYYCFFLFLFTVVSRSSWAWKHDSPTSAFVTTIPLTTTKKGSAYSSDSALLVPSCLLLPKSSSRRRRRSSLLSPLPSTVFTVQDGSSSSKDNNEDATDDKQQQQEQEQQEQVVITTDSPIIKPSSYLDQNLTNDERSIVNIVRTRSPSVACVSSFSIPTRSNNRKKRNRPSSTSSPGKSNQELPVGSVSLGSGSAFAISSDGYLITNYHVIERAYQIQQTSIRLEEFQTNITKALKSSFPLAPSVPPFRTTLPRRAQVYVSLKSSSEINIPSRIVHVLPERDIAILHLNSTFMMHPENISNNNNNINKLAYPPAIPNGLSTDLLVGQTVLAIGNPFGLSQTVTTGVVSSLDRTVKGVAGNDIKGCIQTDAAINPGNSGGPLLNSMGQVVGVNTMIVSTSGSNAGIGFAVPLDGIWDELMDVVEEDRDKCRSDGRKRRRGWLGLKIVTDEKLQTALFQRMNLKKKKKKESDESRQGIQTTTTTTTTTITGGVFVMEVESESPALEAGIWPLEMKEGKVEIGDRIVAMNGNRIDTPGDLKKEIQCRVVGEKVTITVENVFGERRVVYTTLVEKP